MDVQKKEPNFIKSEKYKKNYELWKNKGLLDEGYFIIFNSFMKNNILKRISGNALKLYIFLGSHSNNYSGNCWVTIDTMAKYFERTPRTISYWLKELEENNLIRRLQLEFNGPSHTYLQPYTLD